MEVGTQERNAFGLHILSRKRKMFFWSSVQRFKATADHVTFPRHDELVSRTNSASKVTATATVLSCVHHDRDNRAVIEFEFKGPLNQSR